LDHRARELGERHVASPEPWLTRHLGILPAGASPALRDDYTARAAAAASYRENAGITNPEQAVSPEPHRGNPELEHQRQETLRVLEVRDEATMWAGMHRGQLEAHTTAAERAQATAPPDVSDQLRATAQAEADARQQSADAQIRGDRPEAASASALAGELAAERQQLQADNAEYEAWATQTRTTRENGDKAAAELQRRGHAQPRPEQQTRPESNLETQTETHWLRELDEDLQAVERSLTRQRRAAAEAEQPWPPRPQSEPEPGTETHTTAEWWRQFEADAAAVERSIEAQRQAAIDTGQPWPPEHQPDAAVGAETAPDTGPQRTEPATRNDQDARITEAIGNAGEAARRIGEEQASRQTRSEYAARVIREAQAQPEASAEACTSLPSEAIGEAEIEV
jgi:hypothetical protein